MMTLSLILFSVGYQHMSSNMTPLDLRTLYVITLCAHNVYSANRDDPPALILDQQIQFESALFIVNSDGLTRLHSNLEYSIISSGKKKF